MLIFFVILISVAITWVIAREIYSSNNANDKFFEITVRNLFVGGLIDLQEAERLVSLYYKHKNSTKKSEYSSEEQVTTSKETIQPQEPERKLTEQEIKERNITWILSSGVVLVLIAGLVFATTNWSLMGNLTKAVLLVLVGALFFTVSVAADKLLRIEKTSFAFWILGSLFLPVSFLAFGYFRIFGDYLSVFGEGKYLLGLMGAIACLFVYVYSTYKYKSGVFAWISLIDISLGAIFLILSFYPSKDMFYSAMIVYNAILIFVSLYLKKLDILKIFTKQTNNFIQANLILTTAFALFLYDNQFMYSLNIIFAAFLYMLVILTTGLKRYDYVFNILFAYGLYSLINSSPIGPNVVLYAFIGISFLIFAMLFNKDGYLKKNFEWASGIAALISFALIFSRASLTDISEPYSILNLIAYILITGNYLYLAATSKSIVFNFLVPICFLAVGYESFRALNAWFEFDYFNEYFFGWNLLLFISGYLLNSRETLKRLKQSSGAISVLSMGAVILAQLGDLQAISTSVMFFVYTGVLYCLYRTLKNQELIDMVRYLLPFVLFCGLHTTYFSFGNRFIPEAVIYYALSALTVFMPSFIELWKKNRLSKPFFWVGHALLLIAVITMFLPN